MSGWLNKTNTTLKYYIWKIYRSQMLIIYYSNSNLYSNLQHICKHHEDFPCTHCLQSRVHFHCISDHRGMTWLTSYLCLMYFTCSTWSNLTHYFMNDFWNLLRPGIYETYHSDETNSRIRKYPKDCSNLKKGKIILSGILTGG